MVQLFREESNNYQRVENIIKYIEENFQHQPELKELSEYIGLSESHLQRLFKRWVGISPKRFLQYLTKEHAKKLLRQSENVLSVTYKSGLSGPGRLHDLFVRCEAVTPGEYKLMGEGLQVCYGIHDSTFGRCLIAQTKRGICGLFFLRDDDEDKYIARLAHDWPLAELKEDYQSTLLSVKKIFDDTSWNNSQPLSLFLQGTNFQIKVWEALLKIPRGYVVSYEDIAAYIGNPKAVRAVGSAIARNPVSYMIPCHRVIRKYGEFGNYQGGTSRKKAILAWEVASLEAVST